MYADANALEEAHALGMRYNAMVMLGAARSNQLAAVQFLRARGCPLSAVIFNLAAARGHTSMCAFLLAEQCPWTEATCTAAAVKGHASTLHWLREHGCRCTSTRTCMAAAKGGSVDVLVYLKQQGLTADAELTMLLNIAGAHNKLAAAKWLRQQGAEWPALLSLGGQRWLGDTLTWARAEGCTSSLVWADDDLIDDE
jgi:hypothetical protein